MPGLEDLYQEVILEYSRNPRNFRKPEQYTHHIRGLNPLCGDEIDLYVFLNDHQLKDIAFQGQGCSISMASASFMTEQLKGKTIDEARNILQKFLQMVTTPFSEPLDEAQYGDMMVFGGVRAFPTRVKCATLAWHALEKILENPEGTRREREEPAIFQIEAS